MPADGFLVPSYDSSDPGVLLGVQADWDNSGKFNIKIKRVSHTNTWSDWVAVTNTDGAFVEYDSVQSEYKGFLRTFYEENGPTYILWLDTATVPSGLKLGVFNGTNLIDLSTNSGTGYHLADIDVSSMSINDDNVSIYANNSRFGVTYFDSNGKELKFFDWTGSNISSKNTLNLSPSDYDYQNYYFSINSSSEAVVFKRDSVSGSGGSLYFNAYDKDITQIFPYSLLISSSAADNTRYSYIDVSDIGGKFAFIAHEEQGSGPWSYNTYLQVLSTALPPLEDISVINVNEDTADPLQVAISIVDPNNIINSDYYLDISTSNDFSTVIYSTKVINADTSSTTKPLLTMNGLTHGRDYWLRAKVVDGQRSTGYASRSYSSGTEASHLSEMGIGKWSIKNHIIPFNPYRELDAKIVDAGSNQSFYILPYYDYASDELTLKVTKYGSNGTEIFTKDIVSGIKYYDGKDNSFSAASDGQGGFVVLWSSSTASETYAFVSRYDSSATRQWVKNITGSNSTVLGFDSDVRILADKIFALYADSVGDVYVNSFNMSDGNMSNLNFGVNASGLDIVSITTTTDNSLIVFYGNSTSISAKKINYSNAISQTGGPYSIAMTSNNSDTPAVPDNAGGAYFAYVDSSNGLKFIRVDSSLGLVSGYPKSVGALGYSGYYTYDVGYSPSGPVFAYLDSSNNSNVQFWNNSDSSIKTSSYTTVYGSFKISYNKTHNRVAVASILNTNARADVYISEYDPSTGNEAITPLAGAKNLYGISMDYPRQLVLEPVSDFFMMGYVSPENAYIQQISTYVSLNVPTDLSAGTVNKNSIQLSWTENNSGVTDWYIRYSTESSFDLSLTTEVKINSNPYTVSSLSPNTTYYFQVKSSSGVFDSPYTQSFEKSTLAETPSSLTAQSRTDTSLAFSWNANGNGTGTLYNIVLLDGSNNEVGSSTSTALSGTFNSLSPNTTYYAKVRAIGNNSGDITAFSSPVSTKTLITITDVSNVAFSDVAADSVKVSFDHASGAKLYQIEASSVSAFDVPSIVITSSTANKYAVFGTGGEGSLMPNTTYYLRVKAIFDDEQTVYKALGSTVTLANPPTSFDFADVYVSSVSFTWNKNSNPDSTKYKIRYTSDKGNGSVEFTGVSGIITGLKGSTTYEFYLSAINHSGLQTSELHISTVTDVAFETIQTIDSAGGIVSFDGGNGEVKFNIPSNAFDSITTVTVKLPDTTPSSSRSVMGNVTLTGIYVEINTGGVQPKKSVEISMEYPSTIGLPEDTLVVARHDDTRGVWIPLKSYVDKTARKVRAYTDHFSVFSILSVTPASSISEPKIAPNPLRPSKGAGYSSMTFSNLPVNAEIIIYSVSGVKVKKLITDSSGIALWDGKNEDGKDAASGVYFVLIKSGSSTKTIKIGVQR
ncbi:MAG: hypothetical protein Fur0012_05430 [Elusimicrobiota bacterium]